MTQFGLVAGVVAGFIAGYAVGAHAVLIAATDAQKDRYMRESGGYQ